MTDYRNLYNQLHKDEAYGKVIDQGSGSESLIDFGCSVLNVGCGRTDWNVRVQRLRRVQRIQAVDISDIAVAYQINKGIICIRGEVQNIPFPDNEFDIVVCFDVLEHIPPQDIDRSIKELMRVASKKVIACMGFKTTYAGPRGERLHLTEKDKPWWIQVFRNYGEISIYKKFIILQV